MKSVPKPNRVRTSVTVACTVAIAGFLGFAATDVVALGAGTPWELVDHGVRSDTTEAP